MLFLLAAGVKGTIAEFTAAMQMLFVDHKFMTQAVELSFVATLLISRDAMQQSLCQRNCALKPFLRMAH